MYLSSYIIINFYWLFPLYRVITRYTGIDSELRVVTINSKYPNSILSSRPDVRINNTFIKYVEYIA